MSFQRLSCQAVTYADSHACAVTPATKIDLRVGCLWDGGVVYYQDGHKSHWGPMWRPSGQEHHFGIFSVSFLLQLSFTNSTKLGGHASQKIELPPNVEIKKIQVNRGANNAIMDGVRMYLSNGTVAGELNANGNSNVFTLGMSIVSLLRPFSVMY